MNTLADLESVECPHGGGAGCRECVAMCEHRPCWGIPDEAQALLAAGFGARLMADYWVGGGVDGGNIYLLSPAIVGHEGQSAPSDPHGRCTFLTADGLCELHALGLKPLEGRLADCRPHVPAPRLNIHEALAQTWNTPTGQALVRDWEAAQATSPGRSTSL